MLDTDETDFVKLLKLLYTICHTIHTHGIDTLKEDLKHVNKSELLYVPSLWKNHSENMDRLVDLLRLMLNKDVKIKDLKYFWKQSSKYSNQLGLGKTVNPYYASINDCMWSTMRALLRGYTPEVAIEFGRGAILNNQRLRYNELEELISYCKLHLF